MSKKVSTPPPIILNTNNSSPCHTAGLSPQNSLQTRPAPPPAPPKVK